MAKNNRSFWALMTTQFFGAFNDNLFKITIALLITHWMSEEATRSLVPISGGVFAAPFLLFSLGAGRLADRWSKTRVVVTVKTVDLGVVVFLLAGIFLKSVPLLMGGLFLLGTQSAFFSPAKYGLLPEIKPETDLPRANALLNVATFAAILLGTIAGTTLTQRIPVVAVLTGIAAIGSLLAAWAIEKVPAANPTQPLRWNPVPDIKTNWDLIRGDRTLRLSLIASSWFWFMGGVLQLNVLVYVKQIMGLSDSVSGVLLIALVIGIALGSLLAGRLSHEKVELGLIPLGALGLSLFTLDLFFSHGNIYRTFGDVFCLGISAGVFIIPINTLIQIRSPRQERGRILATGNFFSFVAILLASVFLWVMSRVFKADPSQIFLVLGLLSLLATVAIVTYLPQAMVRLGLFLLTNLIYRIRVVGLENIPSHGPALIIPNHVSYVDPFLVGGATSRRIRFMMFREMFERPLVHPFVKFMDVIPISPSDSPKRILSSLLQARRQLEEGHVVCIFAEGAITRLGQTLGFRKGFERIVRDLDVPIIPVHLDRVWGSIFSFERKQFIWKMPRQIPYPVTVSFGKPLPPTVKSEEVRQSVLELGSTAFEHRLEELKPLHQHFFRQAQRQWGLEAVVDTTGVRLTYGRLATGAILVSKQFRKVLPSDKNVGVLLPPGVGGVIANLGLLFDGRVPVHLNYSLGREVIDHICREAGVTKIITAHKMLDALKWGDDPRMVFLEDIPRPGKLKGLISYLGFRLMPAWMVEKMVVPHSNVGPADLATILFTSGSTGLPKGVMLTHSNIHSNIQGLQETFQLTSKDTILGVLPFFHSFGFTATLWLPLLAGCRAAYHRSPLEAVAIKNLIRAERASVLLATPTFLQMWVKKFTREDVASLRFVLTGAEKLSLAFAKEFSETLGVPILEGYGTTELSPAACVSVLSVQHATENQTGWKPGKVGRPLPGVTVKIVDPKTGERQPEGVPGLLLVKGPNVMRGYWNQPEKTAEVLNEGWYNTGDIARVDEEGFVEITDRLSRFSKIGGEMVPHMLVEQKLAEFAGESEARFLVLSVPDEKRGERLVVLIHNLLQTVAILHEKLEKSTMPKLWVPDKRSIFQIDEWPALASGKADLVKAKSLAEKLTSSPPK
jgi:acyl-[acyl-carrier-protein]-phospholipid O-acyltransferase/long-chain-fatty-acid--[acyl-carrier-protein] ligase